MKTTDQLIDELDSTDIKVETVNFNTSLKQERKRQLNNKLDRFKSQRPKLTEQEDREIADRQLTQWKEDK